MGAMRRLRLLPAALATIALTAGAVLVATAGSSAAPTASQELFEKTLLDDPKTSPAIKRLLGEGGSGFVASDIVFSDITGDERSDAVVSVETGGVAGAVAVYLFSTDGEAADSPLRAVYRSQRLYRASVEPVDRILKIRTPQYAPGDDVCCPPKIKQRQYEWNAESKTLVHRNTVEFDLPA